MVPRLAADPVCEMKLIQAGPTKLCRICDKMSFLDVASHFQGRACTRGEFGVWLGADCGGPFTNLLEVAMVPLPPNRRACAP